MTWTEFILPSAAIILALTWLATCNKRAPKKTSDLLKNANTDLADQIYPLISPGGRSRFYQDNELWEAMNKERGLVKIWRSAGAIASAASYLALECPECEPELRKVRINSMYLRVLVPLCLIEAVICTRCPRFPRIIAWGIARLYCDIASSIDVGLTIDSVG
jgi:hypothetical protein